MFDDYSTYALIIIFTMPWLQVRAKNRSASIQIKPPQEANSLQCTLKCFIWKAPQCEHN